MEINWDEVLLEVQEERESINLLPSLTLTALIHFMDTYLNANNFEENN
jgi:hypothetical protein